MTNFTPSPVIAAAYRAFVKSCVTSGDLQLPDEMTIEQFIESTDWVNVADQTVIALQQTGFAIIAECDFQELKTTSELYHNPSEW